MVFDALDKFLFTTATGITATGDKTGATATQTVYSDWFDLSFGGTGYTQPLYAVIRWNAAANASGSNTVTFVVQKAADNNGAAGTPYDAFSGQSSAITLTTSAQTGLTNIPIETRDRWVRLAINVTGGGSTPTITVLSADVNVGPL